MPPILRHLIHVTMIDATLFEATYFMPLWLFDATYYMPPISCHPFHATWIMFDATMFDATMFHATKKFDATMFQQTKISRRILPKWYNWESSCVIQYLSLVLYTKGLSMTAGCWPPPPRKGKGRDANVLSRKALTSDGSRGIIPEWEDLDGAATMEGSRPVSSRKRQWVMVG